MMLRHYSLFSIFITLYILPVMSYMIINKIQKPFPVASVCVCYYTVSTVLYGSIMLPYRKNKKCLTVTL